MKKSAVVLGVSVGLSAMVSLSPKRAEPAEAAPAPKKVTICHRTHATTNPYVRITVSESSISNAANKHGGQKHDQYYGNQKPVPNVYNPAISYPANEKKWGDIIPNVYTDGSAFTAAGSSTNFTGIGVSIWNGTAPYADYCKAKSARDFYELEKANGVPDADILTDLDEMGADEYASQLSACGGTTFVGCAVDKLGTPTATSSTTTVAGTTATTVAGSTGTTVAGSTATTVAGSTTGTVAPRATLPAGSSLRAGTGGLQVRIWIDANRDGKKDDTEPYMGGIKVTITGPGGVTVTKTTDANGNITFLDLTPGAWTVVPVLPKGDLEKVYDSDGTPDWSQSVTVVEGEVTSTKFASAGTATITAAAPTEEVRVRWAGKDGKFDTADDAVFVAQATDGVATFEGVPAGKYQVTAASAFKRGATYTQVSVEADAVEEVEVQALPATGANRVNLWIAIGVVMLALGVAIRRRQNATA